MTAVYKRRCGKCAHWLPLRTPNSARGRCVAPRPLSEGVEADRYIMRRDEGDECLCWTIRLSPNKSLQRIEGE